MFGRLSLEGCFFIRERGEGRGGDGEREEDREAEGGRCQRERTPRT